MMKCCFRSKFRGERQIPSTKLVCRRCGAKCCKPNLVKEPFNINLSPGDFSKLLDHNYHAIIDTGFDDTSGISLILKSHIFGFCCFLDYFNNECQIYHIRPKSCKRFPYDPRVESPIKDLCLIVQRMKRLHLSEIGTKLLLQVNSKEEQEFLTLQDESDALQYSKTYLPTIENYFTGTGLKHIDHGSFLIESRHEFDISLIQQFYDLVFEYQKYFLLEKVAIDCLILNSNFAPLVHIQGILSNGMNLPKSKIIEVLDQQGEYYTNIYDGSYLNGVLFRDELNQKVSYWKRCWKELSLVYR